ncbi:hypothetical protein NDU88_011524 [Pleurodeles waltl]|uniref:Uncharacterized protein n=1 Tax=Pleurodeles waltl TaxID=8319 RepID=A0AAV7PY06_PLEWA|nr:hypothetical protein NDU88_011524 [Pleurodeles waltl]
MCNGPLLLYADPSSREEKTDNASSDPKEHDATPNPLSLPSVEGQGKLLHAFLGCEKEDTGMDGGGGGESGEEKESRRTTDGYRGRGGFVETDCRSEGLSKESAARGPPSANSSHA